MSNVTDILNEIKQVVISSYKKTYTEENSNLHKVVVETCKNQNNGDYATNIAMIMAKELKKSPIEIAQKIAENLQKENIDIISKVSVAKPGFINFEVSTKFLSKKIHEILNLSSEYGKSSFGKGKKVLLEMVSANPTGPLHVGHGRGAAYGDSLARIMRFCGFDVTTEYYVNDAGRQIDILLLSFVLRYLQNKNQNIIFPEKAYSGSYIIDLMSGFLDKNTEDEICNIKPPKLILKESDLSDEEVLCELLVWLKSCFPTKKLLNMRQKVSSLVLDIIKNQLNSFGIGVDNYFHESSLFENKAENTNKITEALDELQRKNHLYVGDDDSNTWFKSSDFGDDKDRVVIRSNGEYTYFATDIAYHKNKFDRGYETAIDVWGSDHHGYISRIEASLEGMDIDKSKLHCELIQFVSLIKDGKRASMSTRSGEFVTIDDLLDEVGKDATRYFYIARKSNQHVDFDLNLAISKTKDNPVFYIQYANARICSIVDQIDEKCDFDKVLDYSYSLDSERKIINCLAVWENTVLESAELKQPHLISNYLEKLAALFHSYYSENKIK